MRALQPRRLGPGELARIVTDAIGHLEPGLRVVARRAPLGETILDILAVDGGGAVVLIGCPDVADAVDILPVLEAAAWWREHGGLAARALTDVLDPAAPPRPLLVAARFTDQARRLLRTLGPTAPAAIECRVFEDGPGVAVAFERLPPAAEAASAPRPADPPVLPVAGPPAAVAGDPADRAAALVERLERLRLTEAFR